MALFPGDFLHRINRPGGFPAGVAFFKDDIHDGRTVFIVIINTVEVDKCVGRKDIRSGIQPHDLIHTVNLFQLILILLSFIQCYIFNHNPSGTRIAEFLFHQIQSGFRLYRVRKIPCEIIIDIDKGSRQH